MLPLILPAFASFFGPLICLILPLIFFNCSPNAAAHQLHPSQRQSSIFERVNVKIPVCHPIEIPLCRDVPYNRTILPNPFLDGMDTQSLQSQTEHFKPLIRTKCSPHILFFICSAFAPMCPEQLPQAVTSCRSVCEEVQRDCIKIFREFDFPWPPILNCSRFPSPPDLCMRPEPLSSSDDTHHIRPSRREAECPQDLVDLEPTDPEKRCAFRCEKSTMFKKDLKEQARLWLLMCALLNVCVASFTVCSFCIDRQRAFPERSICFLALCSLLASLPHLFRPLVGFDSMACSQLPSGAKFLLLGSPLSPSLLSSSSSVSSFPTLCLVSFLLHFAFSLAASMWWLMLTFTWYLSAARKWAEEAIERRSWHLHALAWGVPALFASCALYTHRMDASELTGLCSVGNADPTALLWLWTVPRLVTTLMGLYLILAGFSAMCKERNIFRRRGTDTSKLEKFMCKIGLFALFYVCPSLVGALCDLHHLSVLVRWIPHTVECKQRGGAFSGECIRPEQPAGQLYVLGATMVLSAGMATGLWMLSPKTLNSWKNALTGIGKCCGNGGGKGKNGRGGGGTGTNSAVMLTEWRREAVNEFAGTPTSAYSSARPTPHHHHHQHVHHPGASLLHHHRRPSSSLLPPISASPLRPLLSSAPPPTAAPSTTTYSAAVNGFHVVPPSLAPSSAGHHRQLHYIPLSAMANEGMQNSRQREALHSAGC